MMQRDSSTNSSVSNSGVYTPANFKPLTSAHPCLSLLQLSRNTNELTLIHSQLIKHSLLRHPLALTCLMATFAISPSSPTNIDHAQFLFDCDNNPNSFAYYLMIRGYSQSNRPQNTLSMFYVMVCDENPTPNLITFHFVIKACSCLNAVKEGRQVHGQVFKYGVDSNLFVQNGLIAMYMTGGCA